MTFSGRSLFVPVRFGADLGDNDDYDDDLVHEMYVE